MVRGSGEGEEKDGEEDLGKKEVRKVIKRLKGGKAMRRDEIPSEVWKYGGGIVDWIWEICRRIWREEEWSRDWREGVILPIRKKGEGERAVEYIGVTLTQTAYRAYASVLAEKLKNEVEEMKILPPGQMGFKKGMGAIDNIYVLNYLITGGY